jgi:hypothetical protein
MSFDNAYNLVKIAHAIGGSKLVYCELWAHGNQLKSYWTHKARL